LFTLLGGFQRELDSHAEAGMCHLHDALHAQLHGKSANDDLDGSTRRKRLRRFHVAAAGADVAKHTAIRHGASLAENICSEAAGGAQIGLPVRPRSNRAAWQAHSPHWRRRWWLARAGESATCRVFRAASYRARRADYSRLARA